MIIVFGQYHSSLTDALDKLNEPYVIIKDVKRYQEADAIDFSDNAAVLNAARNITPQPKAIIAMYEQYIPLAARIGSLLGITHALSYEAAVNATDKVSMRQAFSHVPDISPAHIGSNDIETAREFVDRYGYPVIVKPANLSKSMLISRCDSDGELEQAYASIQALAPSLYKKYTVGQTPKFIIEQFMEGTVHTLAGFVDSRGNVTFAPGIVDNISANEAGYDDNFILRRTLPSRLSAHQQTDAIICATKAIGALGLRSCPAHVEIIMTNKGARIIEIGARLGGYRPLMYEAAADVDLLKAAILSYEGESPNFTQSLSAACSVIELFPHKSGTIDRIEGITEISELESTRKVRLAKTVGDTAGRAADGNKAIGYVILSNTDRSKLTHDANAVTDLFSVKVVDQPA